MYISGLRVEEFYCINFKNDAKALITGLKINIRQEKYN